jgi:hypothetical protein
LDLAEPLCVGCHGTKAMEVLLQLLDEIDDLFFMVRHRVRR